MMVSEDSFNFTHAHDECGTHEEAHEDTELNAMYFAFSYLDLILMIVSVIVLAAGLASIHLCKKEHNQNIILAGLTATEMFGAIIGILDIVLERNESACEALLVIRSLRSITFFGIVFTMYILTIDRLVMVADPHKYNNIMTRRRTMAQVVIVIMIAIILGIVKSVVQSHELVHILTDILLAIGVSYIIVAVGTYTFVAIKINRPVSQSVAHLETPRPRLNFKKQFLMPMIIIVTFILFHAIPLALLINIYHYWEGENVEKKSHHVGYGICILGAGIGYITDVVTYVFLTPRYKRSLTKFRRRMTGMSVTSSMRTTSFISTRRHTNAANPTCTDPPVSMAVASSHFQPVED